MLGLMLRIRNTVDMLVCAGWHVLTKRHEDRWFK